MSEKPPFLPPIPSPESPSLDSSLPKEKEQSFSPSTPFRQKRGENSPPSPKGGSFTWGRKRQVQNKEKEPSFSIWDIAEKASQNPETFILEQAQKTKDICPKCGGTDLRLDTKTGKLVCSFCKTALPPTPATHTVFFKTEDKNGLIRYMSAGSSDIDHEASPLVRVKCESCGAEVEIDTSSEKTARCHWCRNVLSLNKALPSGAIPDIILPFKVDRETAEEYIATYVKKHRFFAHPKFRREFCLDNIIGVYFPYMCIDKKGSAIFSGVGEKNGPNSPHNNGKKKEYTALVYRVSRSFDAEILGLTIESFSENRNFQNKDRSTNIINSIMPFDVENAEDYRYSFIRDFNVEHRDMDYKNLLGPVHLQTNDIMTHVAYDTTKDLYDRGCCWKNKSIKIEKEIWRTAYFPVWLYSYVDRKQFVHFVAVNGRTEETRGSIPINKSKLVAISAFIEIIGIYLGFLYLNWYGGTSSYRTSSSDDDGSKLAFVFFSLGFIFYLIQWLRYRNAGAIHHHEEETPTKVSHLVSDDMFLEMKKSDDPDIAGRNDQMTLGRENSKMTKYQDMLEKYL